MFVYIHSGWGTLKKEEGDRIGIGMMESVNVRKLRNNKDKAIMKEMVPKTRLFHIYIYIYKQLSPK